MLNVLRCDVCGREQEIRAGDPADQTNGWGVLHVAGGKRDLCPVCIGERTTQATRPSSQTLRFDASPRGSHMRAS
jgi:hypothetical protein